MKVTTFAALAGALLLSVSAQAAEFRKGDIAIESPWARTSPMSARNGAAFMVLKTEGKEPDRLIRASSPVSNTAELHTHLMEDGVAKMRPVAAMDVVPGTPTQLKPGSLHIMLMELKAPLKEGDKVPLTLTFEKAGDVAVEAVVAGAGAMSAPSHH
ncbi:MAG: copper chaperone PCu(A)C [Solirubrobacterales bacterium]